MPDSSPRVSSLYFFLTIRALGLGVGLLALGSVRADVYPKIEASFSITNLATDPFDYTQTDVRVQISQPDSTTASLPAFFDGGTTWRVRHTPSIAGLYQVTGLTLNGQPLAGNNLQPSSWMVGGRTTSPGFVRVDSANTNRFITSNGRRYFPLGHNVAWDISAATDVPAIMAKLGGTRENWSRVWMDHWDGKNLDWPKVGANFGTLSLTVAQKWDAIVSAAEQSGVAFQMTLQHHGQYSTTVDPNWAQNPYNSANNGGFLANATQFFTNATARALTKRKLRYAVARWGYSPAIMAWELFNEVQFTDAVQNGQWSIVSAWHDEMAQFIRSQDLYQHLISTSSQLDQPIWTQCDYYSHHDYPTDLISTLSDPPGVPLGQPVKPIFGGESGSDATYYYGLHAPLWAGLMAAQSGAAEPWYWDRFDAEGGYGFLRSAREFILRAGVAEQDGLIRSAPHVNCSQNSSLVFSLGGNWGNAVQDTFTVGDVAPDGIGSLPSYLQGNYHRSMTPNGYTFVVNYPAGGGTFSAQVIIVAAAGAGLTIYLDGTVAGSVLFPGTGSDQNTNYVLTVNVPAGQHTIKLWNPGLDWVDLGNLTLAPYVPMLGAYQISNTNFAALWFWHRTNIYNATANASLAGTFPLAGLKPGNYQATWWDTITGTQISNFLFSVTDTNPVTISTPTILRSTAMFAGTPPQAALQLPVLTRAVATNSPPLNLTLGITNNGGLPLAYSMCITGVSPVIYTSADSSQLRGPGFAWKDISGVGRDLTTNFTALTPKSAKDEGIAGPIDIGFSFPFFSGAQSPGVFSQVYLSPNGFVTFAPFTGDTSTNRTLPNLSAPANCIAFFWDDLDLSASGKIYSLTDAIAGAFTLQFQNVPIKNTSANVTCQLILKTTGEILLQYKNIGVSNNCTVGLQNGSGTQGRLVAFNQSYLQSGFAISLTPTPWLSLSANAGLVPKSAADTITLTLDPTTLTQGTYSATLLVKTVDPALPVTVLPVSLTTLAPIDLWRQLNFGTTANDGDAADNADPDHDGLINIVEYALNTSPTNSNPSPISYSLNNGHLELTFSRVHPPPPDVSFVFQVTSDLVGGQWQSGPAFTSQSIVDNGDGTETVTLTDNTPVATTAAHFLRIVINRQ